MKYIGKNSKVFDTEEFQKDKYKFDLIFRMLEGERPVFISDEDSYIIGRGTLGYPTWIWTKDGISRDKVYIIEKLLDRYLTDDDKDKFTCKKELYDYFLEDGLDILNKEDYFEMGTLCCHEVKKPRDTDGRMDKVKRYELRVISQYWYDSCMETQNIDFEAITMGQAIDEAVKLVDSENFYVWRNKAGKIVCMVNYDVVGKQAKINHVYTPPEERRRGYAENLVYEVTKKILEDGLVPLLYTDYNYVASNKTYKNVGYVDTGVLINFTCSKSKKKTR